MRRARPTARRNPKPDTQTGTQRRGHRRKNTTDALTSPVHNAARLHRSRPPVFRKHLARHIPRCSTAGVTKPGGRDSAGSPDRTRGARFRPGAHRSASVAIDMVGLRYGHPFLLPFLPPHYPPFPTSFPYPLFLTPHAYPPLPHTSSVLSPSPPFLSSPPSPLPSPPLLLMLLPSTLTLSFLECLFHLPHALHLPLFYSASPRRCPLLPLHSSPPPPPPSPRPLPLLSPPHLLFPFLSFPLFPFRLLTSPISSPLATLSISSFFAPWL